jgi:hypothetical protein
MKIIEILEGKRCWKGYEKKGTKMMFGKRVNNCVKKKKVKKEGLEEASDRLVVTFFFFTQSFTRLPNIILVPFFSYPFQQRFPSNISIIFMAFPQ